MTLDLLICILGVPVAGIAVIEAASARQFILRDGKLVGLAGLNDEFAPVSLPYAARNRTSEVTMTKPVEDDLTEAFKRLAELRPAGLPGVCLGCFVMHCAAAPSWGEVAVLPFANTGTGVSSP
jgi:hypothetical protein